MKVLFYILLILRTLHLHVAFYDKEEWHTKIITLKQGDVRGRILRPKKYPFFKEVEVYLGIPYAAPPVSSLRFMPPGAPPSWTDTYNAFEMKPVCPQMFPDSNGNVGSPNRVSPERNIFIQKMKPFLKDESEDCLYLNVYVPHSNNKDEMNKKNYPVILFIHGESFEWNSGNLYDGSVIASYADVIFVSINFRLGIFGFLKQGFMAGRANYGLSDQIAALQWIKGNIAEFGGDSSRVTVMGHDTGAACVNFLMLSPVAEGLFHRAILMGGSALSPWALTETPLHYIQLAGELNCSLENNTNCFQKKRKEDIIAAFKKFDVLPFESFTPVVDEVVVLSSPAEHMEKYSLFSKYDLLAGVNEIESYYLLLEEEFLKMGMLMSEGNKYLDQYTRVIFKKSPDIALIKTIEKYLGHLRDTSPIRTRNAVLDALSDMLVTAPLLQTARYHAATHKNTYFYVFGHHTVSEKHVKVNKSIYGDDLPYVLGVPLAGPFYHYDSEYNIREQQLSETVLRYFTNFVKTGNPNFPIDHQFLTFEHEDQDVWRHAIKWPAYTSDRQPFMHFEKPPQVRYRYREEYDRYWNHVLLTSIKNNNDGNSLDSSGTNTIENDDGNNGLTYDIPLYDRYNNFYKFPTDSSVIDKIGNENAANSGDAPKGIETSSVTVTVLIIIGIIFLLVNVITFAFIFYQRGKLRVRENLFRNRFRCKSISVPDIFEENANSDIYAVANTVDKCSNLYDGVNSRTVAKEKVKSVNKDAKNDCDYDTIRVACVKPEAISGKRMKRWPLSRQCSSSTITVDAHSKVRNWIAQEIANTRRPFSRRSRDKKVKEVVEKSTMKRTENLFSDSKYQSSDKRKARKVSVAIDATPAARTGSVLKQIPIEVTKSLDDGKSPLLSSQMKSASSMNCIRHKLPLQRSNAFTSEDSDEYYLRTGTHKSSAHIRLKTPEFLLDASTLSPTITHSHSRSDPSPMDCQNLFASAPSMPLYSYVDKQQKRLKSFADSAKTENSFDSKGTNTSAQYEDLNLNTQQELQEPLNNITRRNFPKVLPNFPQVERKVNNRLSLPPTSNYQDCLIEPNFSRVVRVPPVPPPRLTSTLGRRYSPVEQSVSFSTNSEDCPDIQYSHITVLLKKNNNEKVIIEEKPADIIQTECSTSHLQINLAESIELNALDSENKLKTRSNYEDIPEATKGF